MSADSAYMPVRSPSAVLSARKRRIKGDSVYSPTGARRSRVFTSTALAGSPMRIPGVTRLAGRRSVSTSPLKSAMRGVRRLSFTAHIHRKLFVWPVFSAEVHLERELEIFCAAPSKCVRVSCNELHQRYNSRESVLQHKVVSALF